MSMKEDYKKAQEYLNSKKLYADDFKGQTTVHHSDGSKFIFSWSIYEETDDFLYLWSEHNGYHLWHIEDIRAIEYGVLLTTPREDLWVTMKDFIKTNEIVCEDTIDCLCPLKNGEYSVNELLKECCDEVGYYKGKENGNEIS